MFKNYQFKRFDYILVLLVVTISIIGIVAIGSATRIYSADGTDLFRNKQIVGLVSGVVLMLFFSLFDYHWLGKLAIPIFLFNVVLLMLVLIAGATVNNATRWVDIGPFRLQPSEFAKIFTVLVLAKYFDKFQQHINQLHVILGSIVITGVPVSLIYLQPDLSTSLIMFLILAFVIFSAGISYWYVIGAVVIGVPSAMFSFWYIQQEGQVLLEPYQVNRIMSLLKPEMVDQSLLWQTSNSIQAIGSGRLFGKGLYLGKINQYEYLPEPQTDFIFSIIGEEFGFFGCFIVVLLLFLIILRILWIGKDSQDMFGQLIVAGFVAVLTYQTFINIGVTTGIVPNTGMPLPFVSAGISSLWNQLIGIGIILNLGLQRKRGTHTQNSV